MNEVEKHFLEEVRRQFRGHKRLGEGAIAQVKDDELFVAIDQESNSVDRDQEFELAPNTTREELMRAWEQGWTLVFSAVGSLKPDDVMRTVYIRQEPHTVLQALNRALAHYAFHVGQIVFLAKHLRASEWKTLSVPRGKSEEFNRMSVEQRRKGQGPVAKGPTREP